tara:strand:- start:639 stop:1436 length:798 start_codon:yes stop_codon:yes gene_type:complete
MTELNETFLYGEPIHKVPDGLFIPPNALQIFLESFQGPLDLLLYLIKKQNFDILDIPIAEITSQYLQYVDQIKSEDLELAGDYLLMAGILIDIKTKILLPKISTLDSSGDELEDDPRAELAKQLLEYEKFKTVALQIDKMPRVGREWSLVKVYSNLEDKKSDKAIITPALMFSALQEALRGGLLTEAHKISKEQLSVREFMSAVLKAVREKDQIQLQLVPEIRNPHRKPKLIVVFLAVLELARQGNIEISQSSFNSTIWILKTGT